MTLIRILRLAAAAASAVLWVCAAGAQAPPAGGFGMPLVCDPGRDCWIVNLPDADGGPDAADFRCRFRTYQDHKGTDFALRDFMALEVGVDVVAAAPGRVRAIRDGEPEFYRQTPESRAAIGNRECGNGVVIDHGDGWESQYCHMRRGSVAVGPGAEVARGTALGKVGMSGRTQFPHVHVEFRRNGTPRDPFTGRPVGSGCGSPEEGALWRSGDRPGYPSAALYAAGFADRVPDGDRIWSRARSPAEMPVHAPALVLWAAMYGAAKGDVLRLRILDPSGEVVLDRTVRIPRDRARHMEAAGRRGTAEGWSPGRWRGIAELETTVGGKIVRQQVSVPLRLR